MLPSVVLACTTALATRTTISVNALSIGMYWVGVADLASHGARVHWLGINSRT
jgi:hypothetical protein